MSLRRDELLESSKMMKRANIIITIIQQSRSDPVFFIFFYEINETEAGAVSLAAV